MVQYGIQEQLKEEMKLLDDTLQQGSAISSNVVLQLSREIDCLITEYFKQNRL